MSAPSKKEQAYSELLFTLHTKGIYVDGFDVAFRSDWYKEFEIWFNDLSDEQQWKVLDLYRPLTRFERRHPDKEIKQSLT